MPPCTTFPMMTSLMSSREMPARSTAALMAIAPSSGADRVESPPRNFPIGVRAAATMTGTRDVSDIGWNRSSQLPGGETHRGRLESYPRRGVPTTEPMHQLPRMASPPRNSMARAYLRVRPVFTRVLAGVDAVWSGFWLGMLDRDDFHDIDDAHYSATARYRDDAHSSRGLFEWEAHALAKHFPATGRLLLLAAGGGRETYALARLGFSVESYECNRELVTYANDFLARAAVAASVQALSRDSAPQGTQWFDGVIVGWSGYMLVT